MSIRRPLFIAALSALFSTGTLANSTTETANNALCLTADNPKVIGAEYHGTRHTTNNDWQFFRTDNTVAYDYHNKGIAEKWRRSKGDSLSFERMFLGAERRISYTHGDLKALGNTKTWSQVTSPVPASWMSQLELVGEETYRCQTAQRYRGKIGQRPVELVWLPSLQLPAQLTLGEGKQQETLSLTKMLPAQKVQATLAGWKQYDETDYADIGDNESDPFLSKMINQGYIEHAATDAYDAQGHAFKSEHGHKH